MHAHGPEYRHCRFASPPWACSVAASVPLALCSLRVSGDYFVIVSMGFQLGVLQIINNIDITGATGGLSNIPSLVAKASTEAPSASRSWWLPLWSCSAVTAERLMQ